MSYGACVIGLGNVGAVYDMPPNPNEGHSHAGAVSRHRSIRLCAGIDVDRERREQFAGFWKVPAFPSLREMVAEGQPDIFCICVPPRHHRDQCLRALDLGAKAIVCEKPFLLSCDRPEEIVNRCRAQGVLLAVNHWMRWSDRWRQVKEMLQRGELGQIKLVRYIYAKGVYNSGTHAIDILRYLFGEVRRVRAASAYELDIGERNIDGLVEFEGGVQADLRTVDYRQHFTTECDIVGETGRITIGDDLRMWRAEPGTGIGGAVRSLRPVPSAQVAIEPERPLVTLYRELVAALDSREPRVRCSGTDGMKAVRVARALELSHDMGGMVLSADGEPCGE